MSQKQRRQKQRQRTRRQQKRASRSKNPKPQRKTAMATARGRRHTESEATTDVDLQRWSRLLNRADQEPTSVLEDRRCLKPQFAARFFDLCDGKALEAPWVAEDYAQAAVGLAKKIGDRHHLNLARGVAVHACIGSSRWTRADKRLRRYRQEAFDCCQVCASDWLRRMGDLLVETRDAKLSRTFLRLAAKVLGEDLDDDSRGRILFVRGIAHLYLEQRDQALGDVGEALRLLPLSAPQGYFMDAVAMVGCFVQRSSERRHYEQALVHLRALDERLKGVKGQRWLEVRDRRRWVVAQIEAWLGHPRRARLCLERVRAKHIRHSPHRYALAIALDEALIYCLHLPDVHIRSIRSILTACKRDLKLEPQIRRGLREAARQLGQMPWRVREILVQLRRSFVVPVPGLLTERVMDAAAEG